MKLRNGKIYIQEEKEQVIEWFNNHFQKEIKIKKILKKFYRKCANKKYYRKNKEIINKKKNEKIECDICGGSYTLTNKMKHSKTKKHINAIMNN